LNELPRKDLLQRILIHKFMSLLIYDDYGSVLLFTSLYFKLMSCSFNMYNILEENSIDP